MEKFKHAVPLETQCVTYMLHSTQSNFQFFPFFFKNSIILKQTFPISFISDIPIPFYLFPQKAKSQIHRNSYMTIVSERTFDGCCNRVFSHLKTGCENS